jgi:hypothetical protein
LNLTQVFCYTGCIIGIQRGGNVVMASFMPGKNERIKISPAPDRIHNDRTRQTVYDEVVHNACEEAKTQKGVKQIDNIPVSLSFFEENRLGKDLKWYPRRFSVTVQLYNISGSKILCCPICL